MKNLLFTGVLIALVTLGWAAPPKWKANFPKGVNWIKLGALGTLYVSTDDALYGVDPVDGQVKWQHDFLKKIKEEEFEEIENTPFVVLKRKEPLGWPFNAIIDETTGKVILNTREVENCGAIMQRTYLPELNAFFFLGFDAKNKGMQGYFDVAAGKMRWYLPGICPAHLFGSFKPVVADANTVLGIGTSAIYHYDIASGASKEILKTSGNETPAVAVKGNVFYLGTSKLFGAYHVADGSPLWPAVKVKSQVKHLIAGTAGYYVATAESLQYYDFGSGKPLFANEVKLEAPIASYQIHGDKLLLHLAKDGYSAVKILQAQTGQALTKKSIDYKSPIDLSLLLDQGALVKTGLRIRLLDLETGKSTWAEDINFKTPPAMTFDKDKLLAADSKSLYTIDLTQGTYDKKDIALKFEGAESPTSIEVRDEGLLLKSAQNLSLIDRTGNVKYHTYHPAPGQSSFTKIALGTLVAVQATGTAMHNMSNVGAAYTESARTGSPQSYSQLKANNSATLAVMNRRFSATQEADKSVAILTKVTDGAEQGIGLAKVSKETGKTTTQVILNNRKPIYELDELEGMLYYVSDTQEVSGYTF